MYGVRVPDTHIYVAYCDGHIVTHINASRAITEDEVRSQMLEELRTHVVNSGSDGYSPGEIERMLRYSTIRVCAASADGSIVDL